ncbi:MAG: EAL domain-containing protein [Moraxella sp.]|nr:EAL domain-containing protein [Moraxella sp.]
MKQHLNLLVIDEEQLYAEHLVKLLSAYYDEVHLGFLDEKAELIRLLRQEWDVLIFNRAYDMTLTDVMGIIQEHNIVLPIISLSKNAQSAELNKFGFAEVICGDMVKSVPMGQDGILITTICLQEQYVKCKRQIHHLRAILKESEQRANILIENSKSAVAYIDQGVHIFANEPYLQMFGYDSMQDIIGVPVVDLIAGGDNVKGFKQFLRKFDKGDRSQVEFEFESKRTDGTTFASKLQLAAATLDGEPVTQMIIQQNNLGTDAELVKKLAQAERLDPLTGLLNRIAFTEELKNTRQELISGGLPSASLLYVRMDNAPKISSSVGISGLDTVLKQVSYVLDEEFAKLGDVLVARFSDTNFAVLVQNTNQDSVMNIAQSVCQRTSGLLMEVGNRTVTTTLSVGVVMMDTHVPEPQVVLDRAMDTVHEIDIDDEAPDKVKLFDIGKLASEDDSVLAEYLQNALTHNQLQLSYQAIYDIEADNSDLFEVYVTLPMADGSSLTFDKIIPIARKNGLLDKIDRWVLVNATKHLIGIRKTHPTAKMLVGLSSSALEDNVFANNFVANITQLVRAIGDTQALTLQFNEQDLLDYMVSAKRQCMALTNIGCRYGVYSYGATTKSEDILQHLKPAMVRLARSYTKDLDREANLNNLQSLITTVNEQHVAVMIPYIEEASAMSLSWSVGARFLQGDYLQPATPEMVFAPPAEE